MGRSPENRIKAVDNAIDILDVITRLDGEVTELTEEVDIFKSAVYKHLATLSGGSTMPICLVRGEHAVTTDSHAGVELPVPATATSKAILAVLGEDASSVLDAAEFTQFTGHTYTDRRSKRSWRRSANEASRSTTRAVSTGCAASVRR